MPRVRSDSDSWLPTSTALLVQPLLIGSNFGAPFKVLSEDSWTRPVHAPAFSSCLRASEGGRRSLNTCNAWDFPNRSSYSVTPISVVGVN